jgi:hypothetical protein
MASSARVVIFQKNSDFNRTAAEVLKFASFRKLFDLL